jgi:hypothetical protein
MSEAALAIKVFFANSVSPITQDFSVLARRATP